MLDFFIVVLLSFFVSKKLLLSFFVAMPKKIPDEIYDKITVFYEATGNCQKVCELIEDDQKGKKNKVIVSKKSVERWVKEQGLKHKPEFANVFEAKKLIEKEDILNNFKPKPVQDAYNTLSESKKEEGKELAELDISLKLQSKRLISVMMQRAESILKDGVTESDIETFEYEQGKVRSKTTTRTKPLTFKDIDPVKLMQGIGELKMPNAPTFNNNNTQATQLNYEHKITESVKDVLGRVGCKIKEEV